MITAYTDRIEAVRGHQLVVCVVTVVGDLVFSRAMWPDPSVFFHILVLHRKA